jgi:hypothetical protein
LIFLCFTSSRRTTAATHFDSFKTWRKARHSYIANITRETVGHLFSTHKPIWNQKNLEWNQGRKICQKKR